MLPNIAIYQSPERARLESVIAAAKATIEGMKEKIDELARRRRTALKGGEDQAVSACEAEKGHVRKGYEY